MLFVFLQETNMNMWQEGSVLPIKDVRISGGMVHGTCPILVEGNEYIFRIGSVLLQYRDIELSASCRQ